MRPVDAAAMKSQLQQAPLFHRIIPFEVNVTALLLW
jgi:hypothetical protein